MASNIAQKFRSISIFTIDPDETLPFSLAIHYQGRHLVYRKPGQKFESAFYNKFVFKRIHRIFVPEDEYQKYLDYQEHRTNEEEKLLKGSKVSADKRAVQAIASNLKKKTIDLFADPNEEGLENNVRSALVASNEAVETVLSKPYSVVYNQLSFKSNSIADHSMRVSILSTFLGYQLGFVNPIALEQLAAAALLHDIGKTKLQLSDDFQEGADLEKNAKMDEEVLKQHPTVAVEMLSRLPFIPAEVLRIISEHHEARDGSGYPRGLRGPKLYGLSKVFIIANTFDNLVGTLQGSKEERALNACKIMLNDYREKLDPNLLTKATRFLTQDPKGR